MVPFLKQAAAHCLAEEKLEETVLVFPNRRSMVFFRKYLGDVLRERKAAGEAVRPVIAPEMTTIQDFLYRVYDVPQTDRLRLLLELYEVYKKVNPKAEPLDEFIFWGDVILSDFDDVDKYLADPGVLFSNIADLKAIQDSYAYLTPVQREAIERFVDHFRDKTGRLTVNLESDKPGVKERFLHVWNLLKPLYDGFHSALREKGMAYDGMVYRQVAESLGKGTAALDLTQRAFPGKQMFLFIGLNALSECERILLSRMQDAGIAAFSWDYSSEMIRDRRNRSSVFLEENVRTFPQRFPIDPHGLPDPEIRVVNVPSGVGQAKLAPEILKECQGAPVETAFILPDETLLVPLLNSLPPEVSSVNVTMGCPLTGSAVYSLMKEIGGMQLHLRNKQGQWLFYHRQVRAILSSSLLQRILSEPEKAAAAKVRADAKYYIPEEDLRGGPVLNAVFRPVVESPKTASAAVCHRLEDYFREILGLVGRGLAADGGMLLETDFTKRYLTALNIFSGLDIEVTPLTWFRLLERALATVNVPFRGEPLSGLQIMGPLEARALDFRNLVILSAEEGTFPHHTSSASFIPPEVRKGFSLPTHEYQDAVWAYYFYRMIQRAEKVWLVYDSRTEGLHTGEESRYIKQLTYYFDKKPVRYVAGAPIVPLHEENTIPKTQEDIDAIRSHPLSATAVQSWLSCQAKFYYKTVKGLEAPEEVAESLDSGMVGEVFHKTMKKLYDDRSLVDIPYLDSLIDGADKARPGEWVRHFILEEMKSPEVSGRNLVLEQVLTEYVLRTLRYDRDLLRKNGSAGFRILGLERTLYCRIDGFSFKGILDRIDSYRDGEVRIVDYKTGTVKDEEMITDDSNAGQVTELLFGPEDGKRPKIALQLFLYDLLAQSEPDLKDHPIRNTIYATTRLFTDAAPEVAPSPEFRRLALERLRGTLADMVDPGQPFRRTDNTDTCEYCDFKTICGR